MKREPELTNSTPTLHLPLAYLTVVRQILHAYLPHAEIWAYGSRVNGEHYDASDLDLVVRQPDHLNQAQANLWEVKEAFSDSNLPILVQLVDWARIPTAFRDEITASYVPIQSPNALEKPIA